MTYVPVRNHEGYVDLTAYHAIKNIAMEKKKMSEYKFYRGDIFTTTKPDQTEGSPCLIVSSDEVNENSICVMIVYLNDKPAKNETDVTISAKGLRVADCSRVYTLHKSRIAEYVRSCTDEEMGEIDLSLAEALNIHGYTGPDLVDPEEENRIEELQKEISCVKDECSMYMKHFEDMRNERDNLKDQVEKLKAANMEFQDLSKREDKEEISSVRRVILRPEGLDIDMRTEEEIKLEAERDLYKKLYEETMEKLIAR